MSRTILVFLIFIISCNIDNKKDEKQTNHESQDVVNSFILNDDISREFKKYVDEMNFDDSVIYAIEFFIEDNYNIPNTFDTFVDISFNYCDRNPEGYKGVSFINNNVVAIFDKNDIGINFYNKKYIYYIPYCIKMYKEVYFFDENKWVKTNDNIIIYKNDKYYVELYKTNDNTIKNGFIFHFY